MDALADDGVGDICVEDADTSIVDPVDITVIVAREPPLPATHDYLLSLDLSSSVTGAERGVNGEDAWAILCCSLRNGVIGTKKLSPEVCMQSRGPGDFTLQYYHGCEVAF